MLKECEVDSLTLWKIDDVGERLNKINNMIKNWKREEELCLKMSVYDVMITNHWSIWWRTR